MGDDLRDLAERLRAHGQEHVLRFVDELDDAGRSRLAGQVESLDLDLLDHLVETLVRAQPEPPIDPAQAEPHPVVRLSEQTRERLEQPTATGHGFDYDRRVRRPRSHECFDFGEATRSFCTGQYRYSTLSS